MKKFSNATFIIATILFGLLLIPIFFAACGEDGGTLGTNIILVSFAKFLYPTFSDTTLLWSVFSENGATIYFVGLIINCCFYGLLTERIIYFIKMLRQHNGNRTQVVP
ncbi:MAG: hypothetical protein ABIN97_10065 [Ginsengibacter sp.]